ncbi:MAG: tetratricopeptide repeat protein, partial [Nitrospinales bacterium]
MKKSVLPALLALCLFLAAPGVTAADTFTALFEKYKQAVRENPNDAEAQNALGLMYELGLGVQKDYQQAVKWYRLAAEQGVAWAQFNLGLMYHEGQGVQQD